jgi:hypothetical protein
MKSKVQVPPLSHTRCARRLGFHRSRRFDIHQCMSILRYRRVFFLFPESTPSTISQRAGVYIGQIAPEIEWLRSIHLPGFVVRFRLDRGFYRCTLFNLINCAKCTIPQAIQHVECPNIKENHRVYTQRASEQKLHGSGVVRVTRTRPYTGLRVDPCARTRLRDPAVRASSTPVATRTVHGSARKYR